MFHGQRHVVALDAPEIQCLNKFIDSVSHKICVKTAGAKHTRRLRLARFCLFLQLLHCFLQPGLLALLV